MQSAGRPVVIVDAENVRRSLWPNLSCEELVERARALATRAGHDLLIVFDTAPPEQAPDLIGSSYADDEIVRLVDELEGPVWVVTSDRGLRERLAGRVDRVIGGGRFARSL
jgi:rRNA-processing protein FCF1